MAKLTQDNLIRFFEAHNKPCPICEGDEWMVTSLNQPIVNGMLSVEGAYDFPPPAFLTVAIICKHCGHVRHHDAAIVKQWIEDQP